MLYQLILSTEKTIVDDKKEQKERAAILFFSKHILPAYVHYKELNFTLQYFHLF